MLSVTAMRRSLSTGNSQTCPSGGRLGKGNTPFPNPFEQLSGDSRSTSPSTITKANHLETIYEIPAEEQQQHTLRPSKGFLLQRMNCVKETNDDSNWVTICLRCPSDGFCIACGSNTTEPQAILRSHSVCLCDDPNHEKGHH
jgi:hypothetical protein